MNDFLDPETLVAIDEEDGGTESRIRNLSRLLLRRSNAALAKHELRATQLPILEALRSGAVLGHGELAGIIETTASALTYALRPLKAQGFVTVVAGSRPRSSYAAITLKGMQLYDQAVQTSQAEELRLAKIFGKPLLRQLHEVLDATSYIVHGEDLTLSDTVQPAGENF
jgi:DNA-binding MarR family transcriptional regulator